MTIPESNEISPEVKVINPLKGIHCQKSNPIIQDLDYIYKEDSKVSTVIWISTLLMPMNDYISYMREDISKHLEWDPDENPLKVAEPKAVPKITKEVGLDPIH